MEILAFTAHHVCKLTGLSAGQLRYWDKTDFFSPTFLEGYKKGAPFSRIYSFRDVVGLRTIALLRNKHHVPLQELRRIGAWLKRHSDTPWSSLRFALTGRKVVFLEPLTGIAVEPRGQGQSAIAINLQMIANEMGEAADSLRHRSADQVGQLTRNRYVVHNSWVVAGTRVPTQAIWHFHKAGYDERAIIREYPRLTPEDVRTAIEFERGRQAA